MVCILHHLLYDNLLSNRHLYDNLFLDILILYLNGPTMHIKYCINNMTYIIPKDGQIQNNMLEFILVLILLYCILYQSQINSEKDNLSNFTLC